MKVIFIIVLLGVVSNSYGEPSCEGQYRCMACNKNTMNYCDACYNYGSGWITPLSYSSGTCSSILSVEIADCKFYDGVSDNSGGITKCMACQSGKWLIWNYNIARCESDLASSELSCSKVDHCYQNMCYTSASITTSGCRMCNKNYYPSGYWQNGGYSACTKGDSGTVLNCQQYDSLYASVTCYACKKGYAVASTLLSCTSYEVDSNCRILNSDGYCHYCWHSYYFDNTTCKLLSTLVKIGLAAAVLAII